MTGPPLTLFVDPVPVGGRFAVRETQVNLATSLVQLVPAEATRVYLAWRGWTVGPLDRIAVSLRADFAFPTSNGQGASWSELTYRDHGALCQQQWFALTSGMTATMQVIEMFYRPTK